MFMNKIKILASRASLITNKNSSRTTTSLIGTFSFRMVSAASATGGYVMAIDQGTTSSRVLLIDKNLKVIDTAQREHEQICSQPGWCEHDPNTIYNNVLDCANEIVDKNKELLMGEDGKIQVKAIGITN